MPTLKGVLLDHLIRPLQERGRDRQAERLGGLEADHQLEFRRPLDGQIPRLGAFEDPVREGRGAANYSASAVSTARAPSAPTNNPATTATDNPAGAIQKGAREGGWSRFRLLQDT